MLMSEGKEGLAKKSCFSLATKSAGWEERRGGPFWPRVPCERTGRATPADSRLTAPCRQGGLLGGQRQARQHH